MKGGWAYLLLFAAVVARSDDTSLNGMVPNRGSATSLLENLDEFDNYYIQYHGCSWSSYIRGADDHEDDNDSVDEDGYWYMGSVPPPAANGAYSVYGTSASDKSPCQKRNYLSSLYTSLPTIIDTVGISDENNNDRSYYCGDNGYGLGCTSNKRFAFQQYSQNEYNGDYLCDANHVVQTTDSMDVVNESLEATGCLVVTSSQLKSLLTYSQACSARDPECPDPFGILRKEEKAWQSQQPLSVFRRNFAYSNFMWFVGLCGLILVLALLLHEVRITRLYRRKRKFLKRQKSVWTERYLDSDSEDGSKIMNQLYDLTNGRIGPSGDTITTNSSSRTKSWLGWFRPSTASLPTVDSGFELRSYEPPKTLDSTLDTLDSLDENDTNDRKHNQNQAEPKAGTANVSKPVYVKGPPLIVPGAQKATSVGSILSVEDYRSVSSELKSSEERSLTQEFLSINDDPILVSGIQDDHGVSPSQQSISSLSEEKIMEDESYGISLNTLEKPFDVELSPIQKSTDVFEVVDDEEERQSTKTGLFGRRRGLGARVITPSVPTLNLNEIPDHRPMERLVEEAKETAFENALIAIEQKENTFESFDENSILEPTIGEELEILHLHGTPQRKKASLWGRRKRFPVSIVPAGEIPPPLPKQTLAPSLSNKVQVMDFTSPTIPSAKAACIGSSWKESTRNLVTDTSNYPSSKMECAMKPMADAARSIPRTPTGDNRDVEQKQSKRSFQLSRTSSTESLKMEDEANFDCNEVLGLQTDEVCSDDKVNGDDLSLAPVGIEGKRPHPGRSSLDDEADEAFKGVQLNSDLDTDDDEDHGVGSALHLLSELCAPNHVELLETIIPVAALSHEPGQSLDRSDFVESTSQPRSRQWGRKEELPSTSRDPGPPDSPPARKPVGVQSFMASLQKNKR